ncbi:MAG TPA: GDP-mannose 4,6-dehydratase [Thermomicrobiales bacterium]|nr:GDP-mannose 4,6 dehydratase [Chloroflexota bacterium]HQX63721.1 GDP-mannose 4,6-dehydratase [Thermomicrobiales bacterium]HQZ89943.1 GDP-mannose 4,6-dehydratase [Thermomicrobiales bacterium]HRA31779.1 GDP-mannose 4,6-dehydratase [Thermomicrobiales bacterium]
MTTAVITGASGFVGRHLVHELEQETDWRVVGLARHASVLGARTHVLACDLLDEALVRRTIEHVAPDVIFHLASHSYVPQSVAAPAETLTNNLVGQLNVLEAVRSAGLSAGIVAICSAEEYGFVGPDETPITESQPFRPGNPYAVSKIAQDMLAYQYALSYGMPVVRMRPFSHIGPGQSDRFVLSSFARQIVDAEMGRIEPVILVGNLDAVRDFLDVRDVVRAYRLVAVDIVPGEVFNLASGVGRRIGDLLDLLITLSRAPLEIRQDPARLRPSDVPVLIGDASRFRSRVGWEPRVPIETTLTDILDDWRVRLATSSR